MSRAASTRDERCELQAYDDGALDDTVFVVRQSSYLGRIDADGGSRRRRGKTYHREDCRVIRNLDDDRPPQEMTREGAQRRWLSPCLQCVLADTEVDHGER